MSDNTSVNRSFVQLLLGNCNTSQIGKITLKMECILLGRVPRCLKKCSKNDKPKVLNSGCIKIMDRSVDSIGSCSLDVDADSTDFSDTSGSLNLATPCSAKDITREFTSRIRERCQINQINCQQTTTVLDPCSGKINTIITTIESPDVSPAKKPSYLNLACCVNGYSNLTTYDSKLRQNINKSREVSPIRPSANTLQYCRTLGNLLAPPVPMPVSQRSPGKDNASVVAMDNRSYSSQDKNILVQHAKERTIDTTDNVANGTFYKSTKFMSSTIITSSTEFQQSETKTKSFIQQRVERLYGPGALAQGFYSPKKTRSQESSVSVLCERSNNNQNQFSSFGVQYDLNGKSRNMHDVEDNYENIKSNDLPVLRHLRPEFRAQLPILSPKKSLTKICVVESSTVPNGVGTHHLNGTENTVAELKQVEKTISVDKKNGVGSENVGDSNAIVADTVRSIADINISPSTPESQPQKVVASDKIRMEERQESMAEMTPAPQVEIILEKDGNYFLQLLKTEQDRLLLLADATEKEMEILAQSDASEEILGYLRSAAGKARLLVTQKMKQFEGLCKNNLNRNPGEKFPTTNEDLQGFWDMVNLQVNNVDSLFNEIEILKANDWKKTDVAIPPPSGSKLTKRPNVVKANTAASTKSVTVNGASLKKSSAATLAAQKREAQRKQLLELKRKNKMAISAEQQQQQQQNSNSVEIFVSEHCS